MRCKVGDVAMIQGTDSAGQPLPLAGFIVECVRFVGSRGGRGNDWWDVGRKLSTEHSGYVRDCVLIPIRDSDADDETLAWAGNPNHRATSGETAEEALLRRMRELAE